ncbi:MAG: hypothetical protein GWN56_11395 [Nitrosopumilaceae archaeon]|nr:hypothetical protein [Nitrosopumilaceae archaeon]
MYILGISCFFHDSAAAIIKDGQLLAAAEEERFSRIKHDFEFPDNAIDFCMQFAGIEAEQVDYVVFFEKPFVKFERLLLSTMQNFPSSTKLFREAMITWLGDKLWIKNYLMKKINISPSRILFSDHHLSHASSSFFCSPFEKSAIVTVDGVGEWTTATIGFGEGSEIKILKEINFPHSIGLLYSAFTAFLGFEVNEGEYKVMGMAPFGRPNYVDKVYKVIHSHDDGSFELNMDYFSFHYSSERTFNSKFEDIFGDPRDPQALFFTESSGYPSYFGDKPSNYNELVKSNQYYADIAASIQVVTEELVVKLAKQAHELTGYSKLCMAGGVALNSVANWKVLKNTPFDEIYIHPAAGDGGGAVGAALYGYHALLGKPRKFVMEHAYWGKEHSEEDVADFLDTENIPYEKVADDRMLTEKIAGYLVDGKVIGWYQGRFEWGPRALGNRSIIADPRRTDMKDIVNVKIKFREPFRPFAPSVLSEKVTDYFDIKESEIQYPTRFMLYVTDVNHDKKEVLPAITHVDGTGRLQSVYKDLNPKYYNLIETFGEATGVPVILNTSFNLKGEPVVNTPAEAFNSFYKSGMDYLVLGNYVVDKSKLS